MRKTLLLTAGLALATAAPVSAQRSVRSFPQRLEAGVHQAKAPQRIPTAVADKQRGRLMYVGQLTDYNRRRSWCKFYSETAYNSLEKIKLIDTTTDVDLQIYGLRTGAYADGKYYAYIVKTYTYVELPVSFVELDPATGEMNVIHEFNETEQNEWPKIYDMAYDRSTGTLYALAQGVSEENPEYGATILLQVDPEDGSYQEVKNMNAVYYNMAFDYDGHLYMVRPLGDSSGQNIGTELVKFDSDLNEESTVEVSSWGAAYKMGYMTTMSFDFTTGDLWWLPMDQNAYQKPVVVNTSTGELDEKSGFVQGNQLVGLYIPYLTADTRTAAGQVTSIDARAAVSGAMVDTVKWTNPTLAWDRSKLTDLKEVLVYRKKTTGTSNELSTSEEILDASNAELVATLPADGQTGKEMQWVDQQPHEGFNTYYVVPCRESGEKGVPDSIRCYMGLDIPSEVTDMTLAMEGEHIRVNWAAPDHGINNGYVDPTGITYTLTRMPDNKVVARDLAATTLLDEEPLGEVAQYYYLIEPSNKAGKGTVAETPKLAAGAPVVPPTDLTFMSEDDAFRWTMVDNNRDGNQFFYNWDNALILYGSSGGNDDWAISPALSLQGGHTYVFKAKYHNAYPDAGFSIRTAVGTNNTAEAMTNVMRNDQDIYSNGYYDENIREFEDYFTAPADGIYYYGFNLYGGAYDNYYLHSVSISEVMDDDLSALTLNGVAEAVEGADNKCTVTIRNGGKNTQSAYTVKVVCRSEEGDEVVGETTNVPTIESGKTADVALTFKPTYEGTATFVGVVKFDKDGAAYNDTTTAVTINVQPAGTPPFTNEVNTGQNEATFTSAPFACYSSNDASQSLYYAAEVNAPEKSTITRIGYEYDGADKLTDRLNIGNVKIYMANTDKQYYDAYEKSARWSVSTDWIDPEEMTLVYEGEASLDPGKNNIASFTLQTPFEYDRTRNLAVCVLREGDISSDMNFPAQWHVYSNVDYDYDASNVITNYRTLRYYRGAAFSTVLEADGETWVPVLHLSFVDGSDTSIGQLQNGASVSVTYDAAAHALVLGEGIVRAQLYDVTGKLLLTCNQAGRHTVSLSAGVYVVRALLANGQAVSVKLNIAK